MLLFIKYSSVRLLQNHISRQLVKNGRRSIFMLSCFKDCALQWNAMQ